MYSAKEIALWFICKNNAEMRENVAENDIEEIYEGITHLKLQKLLYYAQGVHLSLYNGERLFNDKILAWQHGPVVEKVYSQYKHNGRDNLLFDSTKKNEDIIRKISNDKKVMNTLNIVYDNFAIYTAWQLRNMTHEIGSPWYETYEKHGYNAEIKINIIKKYFDTYVME